MSTEITKREDLEIAESIYNGLGHSMSKRPITIYININIYTYTVLTRNHLVVEPAPPILRVLKFKKQMQPPS